MAISIKRTRNKSRLLQVQVNGDSQWIHLSEENPLNPIVLFLHGGPGFSQIAFAPAMHARLRTKCVVANWDQRASGKSFSKHSDYSNLSIDTYIDDTIEIAKWLTEKYDQKKLFLVGHSWGCTLGMYTIKRCPKLFHAFIGTGFGVNFQEGEQYSMRYLKNKALEANDMAAFRILDNIRFPIEVGHFKHYIEIKSKFMSKFGGYFFRKPYGILRKVLPNLLFAPTYSLYDYIKMMRGLRIGKEIARDALLSLDLFKQIPEVKIPVFFCIGRHDHHTSFELARKYHDALIAPQKEWIWFEKSAHSPLFEESEYFCDRLIDIVSRVVVSTS